MAKQEYEIILANGIAISKIGISEGTRGNRQFCRVKDLIQRVERLLSVDPNSAYQRLFNATIHDLKAKMLVLKY